MRPDAIRNRARILAAAREQVATEGPDVGMDEIAAASGVAVGTLYRHFPTKVDLLAAAVDASIAQIADLTEAAVARSEAGGDAAMELFELFRAIAEQHASDQAVKAASAALGRPVSTDISHYGTHTEAGRAALTLQALLDRAQQQGAIRPDLTLIDLTALLAGVPGMGASTETRHRYVDIVLTGLRTS